MLKYLSHRLLRPGSGTRCISFKSVNTNIIPSISWNGELNANTLDLEKYRAPENIKYKCHWVIPNKFMMGKTPNNDNELMDVLINDVGINTFLTLTDGPINDKLNHIEYIHFPMKNFNVAADENTINLMSDIMNRICENDSKLYAHCNSGHGRAGVISGLVLQCIYGMDDEITRKYLNLIHTTRCDNNVPCKVPEKELQVQQLIRLNDEMINLYKTRN
eukprot:465775_1